MASANLMISLTLSVQSGNGNRKNQNGVRKPDDILDDLSWTNQRTEIGKKSKWRPQT
jgi:hypothetical protein